MKLVIKSGSLSLAVDLKDTPTSRALFDAAPFEEWEEHHSLREFVEPRNTEMKKAA